MSTTDITFSVLVSSYNYQDFVLDAVHSALVQSHAPFEVIVVDDGSTDNSVAVLYQTFGSDARVRIIAKSNGGQMSAWIAGATVAQGDVIALLDSDDLWKPDYLANMARIYSSNSSLDYVYCNMEKFGASTGLMLKRSRHKVSRDLGLSILMGACIQRWQGVATSGNTIKRVLFEKILQLPSDQVKEWKTRPDDCLFYGSDILGGHKYYLAKALVLHREHANNALQEFSNSPIKNARYALRVEKMLSHYRMMAGFSTDWLKIAKYEFRTKPQPSGSECWIYCNLALQAPMRWSTRISHAAAILAYYFQSKTNPASSTQS
jgi:glycosyltransferase involved in cell wall biosynthesis